MRILLSLLKKTSRLLAAGLAAFALLVLLVVGVGPHSGRYQFMTVLTGSMRPNMPEGSVVLSTPTSVRALRVGDVITYRIPVEDRRVVTHRVIEVLEPGVVRTQGDGNKDPDAWTTKLKGQVWEARVTVPGAGFALERLRQPATTRLLVLAVPLALAFLWMRDIWGRKEEVAAAPLPSTASRVHGVVALAALLSLGAACARDRA